MDKIYIIVMLCVDGNYKYTDYINKRFYNRDKALDEMIKCANGELRGLEETGNFEMVNMEDEISIYNEDKELITNYRVIEI